MDYISNCVNIYIYILHILYVNNFSMFIILQYSYILHNIIGLEHDMWNLIDKGFADDEVK